MIRIMLVDDQRLVRDGLRAILEAAGDMDVVTEAADGAEAVRLAGKHALDIALMDLKMPNGMDGIEATRRLLRKSPTTRVIALTSLADDPLPATVREAGASGFLTKGCPAREMLEGIRSVHRGIPVLDARIVARHWAHSGKHDVSESPFEDLSRRELQVLMMILDGRRNNEIATTLALSQKTISTYRQRIFGKLGVGSDVALTRLSYRWGIISDAH